MFAQNNNLLIVLTNKTTASAAETFVDLLHNVDNVLIIGDSTLGCLLGDLTYVGYRLRYSMIPIKFGGALHIFPDGGYFEEMRGFLPDLWVPSGDAEELAIKLILNNK